MQILELIGRIFISLIFLIAGVGKIVNYEGTIGYMESFGVPGYLLIPAIIIEILFPLLVIIGYKTKIAAIVLALLAVVLKPLVFSFLLVFEGEKKSISKESGIRLGQISEFSLLISVLALNSGFIEENIASLIQLSVLISFVLSSYIIVLKYPTPISSNDSLRRD